MHLKKGADIRPPYDIESVPVMNALFHDLTGRAVELMSERRYLCPLSEVSQIIHVNKFTALRKFRAHTGMTPRPKPGLSPTEYRRKSFDEASWASRFSS